LRAARSAPYYLASPIAVGSQPGAHLKLYTYFRSSAAYRVRIALNLKDLDYESIPIHLTKDGGHHHSDQYRAINPHMRVPALELDNGAILTQSLAIMDFLDETYPEPPLVPADPIRRAHIRAFAQVIACDIHPLNNLAPLQYLRRQLEHTQLAIDNWYHHWIHAGFASLEETIRPGPYAFGREVTLADICLVPQMYNARRLKVPLDKYPQLVAVETALLKLSAFDAARPENQPDAE
jgi:maleylpyruvate isomerase